MDDNELMPGHFWVLIVIETNGIVSCRKIRPNGSPTSVPFVEINSSGHGAFPD